MATTGRTHLAVFVGGLVGGAGRIGVSAALDGGDLPWATFVVNVTGALLLGYVITRLARRGDTVATALFCTGVLGSYTTFSTFSLEVWALLDTGRTGTAVAYALASMALGLAAAWTGMRAAERHA